MHGSADSGHIWSRVDFMEVKLSEECEYVCFATCQPDKDGAKAAKKIRSSAIELSATSTE